MVSGMDADRHDAKELKYLQGLPLEKKIQMTQERIEAWYESWTRFEIIDDATGKTRYETIDTRSVFAEPKMKETEWYRYAYPGQVYVSFSGGKDSTVLKHIVDSMYSDVPAVFVNTGLEYPEIQKFAMSQKNVVTLRPEMRFDEVVKKYGYPVISKDISTCIKYAKAGAKTRLERINGTAINKDGTPSMFNCSRWKFMLSAPYEVGADCCKIMKKKPSVKYEKETGRKTIMATMAFESKQREVGWFKTGCNGFEMKEPKSKPMSFWTEQDVLHYIQKYKVPYCSVYGDIRLKPKTDELPGQINAIDYLGCYEPEDVLETTGCSRTGCIFCMFGAHLEKEPNRFQRLRETHPRQYEYCIGGGEFVDGKWQPSKDGLGLGYVLDYIGVKY